MLKAILKRKKSFLRKYLSVQANKTMKVSGDGFEVIISITVYFDMQPIITKTIIV